MRATYIHECFGTGSRMRMTLLGQSKMQCQPSRLYNAWLILRQPPNTLAPVLPLPTDLRILPARTMPAFDFARRLLGRPKATMVTSSSSFWCMDASPQALEPQIPFVLPESPRADLISLAEAQNNPAIVYHSVNGPTIELVVEMKPIVKVPKTPIVPLIPLAMAAARAEIKYRTIL